MSESVIVLDHLSKSFGNVHAVHDLSLQIEPGIIFGFLGANGAGKTTTIRMLCGLTHPTAGNATIAGKDVWQKRSLLLRITWTRWSAALKWALSRVGGCWRKLRHGL